MKALVPLSLSVLACGLLSAEQAPRPESEVRITVTVEARKGARAPQLSQADFLVWQGQERLPVSDWVACRGDAPLELFLLMDDASDTRVASQFEDILDFVNALPASTAVGIGYMRNGMVDIVQPLTTDHAAAATHLRLPMESTGANPYQSLSDLIRGWPANEKRREVLMVTPGSGVLADEGFRNMFVDAAIADAQRAGILIHTIYSLGAGHQGHGTWFGLWAQRYLEQLAEETGGEAYSLGFGAPVSLAPYLSQLAVRLGNQYVLSFLAVPGRKSELQPIRITTEVPNAAIVHATKVYVPGR